MSPFRDALEAREGIRRLDPKRQHELRSASGLPVSIIRFCSFIASATMTPRFYLSYSMPYTRYNHLLCGVERERRGMSSRRVAPVVRRDTVQTFSLSRWLRPPRVYIDYREELGPYPLCACECPRVRTRIVHAHT